MEKQAKLPFPYEIKDFSSEEQDYVDKIFGSNVHRMCRVGPKRFIVYEPYKKEAAYIYNMPLRSTDIFVNSYLRSEPGTYTWNRKSQALPKFLSLPHDGPGTRTVNPWNAKKFVSLLRPGTTWTQELVWMIANNLDYSTAAVVPLVERYIALNRFIFIDESKLDVFVSTSDSNADERTVTNVLKGLSQLPSKILDTIPESTPRFIKSHLPISLLNPKVLDTAKMVYIARDPRDVAVSSYHCAKLFKIIKFPGGFKEFWNLFHKDIYIFCPMIEHVKEAWEKRHHPNMLFLFYEELVQDLPATIRRVADFLRKKLTNEDVDHLSEHLNFKNFKNNKSVNQEWLREHGILETEEKFIRRGKSGGWRDYFDEEMTEQTEQWITANLRDTDLRFPNWTIN